MNLQLHLHQEAFSSISKYMANIRELGISHIGYREFYRDGTSKAICSNTEWYNVNLDLEMRIHYLRELMHLKRNKHHYVIRSSSNTYNEFLKKLKSLDLCNSLIIYKKDTDLIMHFTFIADINNKSIINSFVNELEKFNKIADICIRILGKVFKNSNYESLNKLLIPADAIDNLFHKSVNDGCYNNFSNNKDIRLLTLREMECLEHLKAGNSIKIIASKLEISERTVEYHIRKVKDKLRINSKYEILEVYKRFPKSNII